MADDFSAWKGLSLGCLAIVALVVLSWLIDTFGGGPVLAVVVILLLLCAVVFIVWGVVFVVMRTVRFIRSVSDNQPEQPWKLTSYYGEALKALQRNRRQTAFQETGRVGSLRKLLVLYGNSGDTAGARRILRNYPLEDCLSDTGPPRVVADCIVLKGHRSRSLKRRLSGHFVVLRQLRSLTDQLDVSPPEIECEGYSILNAIGMHARVTNIKRTLKKVNRHTLSAPEVIVMAVLSDPQSFTIMERQGAVAGLWASMDSAFYWPWQRKRLKKYIHDTLANDVELRCRAVRLPSEQDDICYQLRKGLEWEELMTDSSMSKAQLPTIVETLNAHLPEIVRFVQEYPIRLLAPSDFAMTLGYYRSTRYNLKLWTRYTPPVDIGKVITRYLTVDDKTLPNSIGISYRLFEQPSLAVPVLYHEYLHFAGRGRSQGIANEAEVWLRESLFLREMIARNVKAGRYGQDWRASVAREFERAGLYDTVRLLFEDVESQGFRERLNEIIVSCYGPQTTKTEADAIADRKIAELDQNIALRNASLTWCPEIPYPLLRNDKAEGLIRSIITRSATQRNTLTASEFESILGEPGIRLQLGAWREVLDS